MFNQGTGKQGKFKVIISNSPSTISDTIITDHSIKKTQRRGEPDARRNKDGTEKRSGESQRGTE